MSEPIQWIEVLSSERERIQELGREYSMHPLAIEDGLNLNQRAKFDDFETHQLIVWFAIVGGELVEVEMVTFQNALIFITGCEAPNGLSWRDFLRLDIKSDVYHMLHHTLDRLMDQTMDSEEKLFEEIENFEERILDERTNPRELLELKRKLADSEFGVLFLSSVVGQIQRFVNPLRPDLKLKLRDLLDHCERTHQRLVFQRAEIATTMDMYWGITSKRTNDRIKKLTLLAAVSVPLTFWTSFWGMNFEALPFHDRGVLTAALAIMVASASAIYFVLKRKGYWEKD
jgi:magnesium transporter